MNLYLNSTNERLIDLAERLIASGKLVPIFLRENLHDFASTPRPWNPHAPIVPERVAQLLHAPIVPEPPTV